MFREFYCITCVELFTTCLLILRHTPVNVAGQPTYVRVSLSLISPASTFQNGVHIGPYLQKIDTVKLYGVVGIDTRYRLEVSGIESRWGRDFPHPARPVLGTTQFPVQWGRVIRGGKSAGVWRSPPTTI
jgi:hypothetical protein